jgi:hypothetical protein
MIKLTPPNDEQMRQNFRAIEAADRANYKRGQDIDVGENSIILTAPNGTRYKLVVSNAGLLGTVPA